MENSRTYCVNVLKLLYTHPKKINLRDVIKSYDLWVKSQNEERSPIKDELPWIPFAALRFLKEILTDDMRIFEYGSGGSTLFFARRVNEVVSVEHESRWVERVRQIIKENGYENCLVHLVEPTVDLENYRNTVARDPDGYISALRKHAGDFFGEYARSVDKYPDNYFDLILIDGRARPSCAKHAQKKVKKGGYIILDNSERKSYSSFDKLLEKDKWDRQDFFGPGPYRTPFWQATFWHRRLS